MSPIDPNIDGFSKFLATLTDPKDRERAIKQATMLAANAAPSEAFEAPIKTLEDYLNTPIEVPPILVEPTVLIRGGITNTIGRAGKGKTVMNLNRCLKWAAGKPLFSSWTDPDGQVYLNPSHPLRILIIENEGAGGMFHQNLGIMLNANGYLNDEDRKLAKENILVWGDGGYAGVKLDEAAKLDEVRRGCEKWEPDVLFIEPFRGLWSGEENSATDMTKVVDALVDMATDYQCGVLLAHHERKSGVGEDGEKMSAGRGSTVLEGVVTTMENFEGVKGGDFRELSWSKMRYGKSPNPVQMEWDEIAWWYKHRAGATLDEAIITALNGSPEPLGVGQIVELTGEKESRIRGRIPKMLEDRRIVQASSSASSGHGSTGNKYRLPTDESDGNRGGLDV